jgi:hypothetical protein
LPSHFPVLVAGTSGNQVFFRKLDQNQQVLWETLVPGDVVRGLAVDPNGDVYGASNTTSGSPIAQIRAFDSVNGAVKWTNTVSATATADSQVAAAKVGNSVLLFSITTIPGAGSDVLARRINPKTGVQVWANQIDGGANGSDIGVSVVTNAAGAPFLTASLWTGVATVPTAFRLNGTTGASVWSHAVNVNGGSTTSAAGPIVVLTSGDVAIAGYRAFGSPEFNQILSAGTGALLTNRPTSGVLQSRDLAAGANGTFFANYRLEDTLQGSNRVGFFTSGIWRDVFINSDPRNSSLSILGVDPSHNLLVLESAQTSAGIPARITRVGGRMLDEIFKPEISTLDLVGDFQEGLVDGSDFLVWNAHTIRRYRENIQLANDTFNRPFSGGQLAETGDGVFFNDGAGVAAWFPCQLPQPMAPSC